VRRVSSISIIRAPIILLLSLLLKQKPLHLFLACLKFAA
jgi:hypothetical protein